MPNNSWGQMTPEEAREEQLLYNYLNMGKVIGPEEYNRMRLRHAAMHPDKYPTWSQMQNLEEDTPDEDSILDSVNVLPLESPMAEENKPVASNTSKKDRRGWSSVNRILNYRKLNPDEEEWTGIRYE